MDLGSVVTSRWGEGGGVADGAGAGKGRSGARVRRREAERRRRGSEASVYFFCAEALTNVVKHARASSAWVEVAADGERCEVEVRDDGIGGAQARSDSSGLTGLRDRIGALNGVMNIVAPADGGTVLHAVIPLPGRSAGEAGLTP